MSKTVKQWLEELPDGYRERALRQCSVLLLKEDVISMYKALGFMNSYDSTHEGRDFWDEVRMHYVTGQPLPPLPTNLEEENAQLKARIEELENMVLNVLELVKDFEKP